MDFLTYFCQKSGRGTTLPIPPSVWFYCYYRPPEIGRCPVRLWSEVWRSASLNTDQFQVRGCEECGGWQVCSQAWSLALSKWTVGTSPI
jgi:hypothetical protein